MRLNQISTLVEARRNPIINKKIESSKYLEQIYKNDPDPSSLYVTFTDVNKLGINPSTEYNTPNGIYCYPLWFIADRLQYSKNLVDARPFPNNFVKNVIVFRLVDNSRVFDMEDEIPEIIKNNIFKLQQQKNHKDFHAQSMFATLKNATTIKDIWTKIYTYIKDEKFSDNGNEDNGNPPYSIRTDNKVKYSNEARSALVAFRMIGIDGFTNNNGNGTIHSNEPTQAVFFNSRVLKIVKHLNDEGNANIRDINSIVSSHTVEDVEKCIKMFNDNEDKLPNDKVNAYSKKICGWIEANIHKIYNNVDMLIFYTSHNTNLPHLHQALSGPKYLNNDQKSVLRYNLESIQRFGYIKHNDDDYD